MDVDISFGLGLGSGWGWVGVGSGLGQDIVGSRHDCIRSRVGMGFRCLDSRQGRLAVMKGVMMNVHLPFSEANISSGSGLGLGCGQIEVGLGQGWIKVRLR